MIGRTLKIIYRDAEALAKVSGAGRTSLLYDSFPVLAMTRLRQAARSAHVPLVNRFLRLTQTALFGIEIGNEVELGEGVYFIHPLGIVIGGTAVIGDRVRFMGNNTVGTAKDNGYPVIEDDVTVGAGARILGPIRIGAGAVIGANAVVLSDVPAGATAVGIPARVVSPSGARKGPVVPPRLAASDHGAV